MDGFGEETAFGNPPLLIKGNMAGVGRGRKGLGAVYLSGVNLGRP